MANKHKKMLVCVSLVSTFSLGNLSSVEATDTEPNFTKIKTELTNTSSIKEDIINKINTHVEDSNKDREEYIKLQKSIKELEEKLKQIEESKEITRDLEEQDTTYRADQVSKVVTTSSVRSSSMGTTSYGPSQSREAFNHIVVEKGLTQYEINGWASIIQRESGWNTTVWNAAGSGAYGLPQALPGNKMASHGDDWQTNPYTQLSWMYDYMVNRYGSIQGAVNFWNANHWY